MSLGIGLNLNLKHAGKLVDNLDPEDLADWEDNGNVLIADNGDGTITASVYTASGADSISNNIIDSGESIDGRQFRFAVDMKVTNAGDAGKNVEIRLQRLVGGDGASIVNESELDVTLQTDWQRFTTYGTGVAANMGLKALITGGIAIGTICPSIEVRSQVISEVL